MLISYLIITQLPKENNNKQVENEPVECETKINKYINYLEKEQKDSNYNVIEENKTKEKLSRMVATYDWDYLKNDKSKTYFVEIEYKNKEGKLEKFKQPWNGELKEKGKSTKTNTWAEKEETIEEVGSIYTIQGFDLNYVGVILGKSVTYKDGKIDINPKVHKNKGVKGEEKVRKELISNEINVLMTRGVKGLYIYAEDENLRNILLKKQNKKGELI